MNNTLSEGDTTRDRRLVDLALLRVSFSPVSDVMSQPRKAPVDCWSAPTEVVHQLE